jgi:GT2 family glycosyltransferase
MGPSDTVLPVYVIHWNASEWCASAARSILASDNVHVDLTVVDNGQVRGAPLEDLLPEGVRVLRPTRNLGYSGGANLALEDWRGRNLQSELCVIGTHDLHVREDALMRLVEMAAHEEGYGILGPALLSPVQSSGGYWTGKRAGQLAIEDSSELVDRDWVSGSCMLLRRGCVESVGGFDESFNSYVEDVEFCLRAKDAGWKVGVVTEAIAWGLGSASSLAGPLMVVNGIRLIARRHGAVAATLSAVGSFASLGFQVLMARGASLADGKNRPHRRSYVDIRTRTIKQILTILRRAWIGNGEQHHISRKTHRELRPRAVARTNESPSPTTGTEGVNRNGPPLVSVVITTRHRPQSAIRGIESALRQTIPNIEVVVVDDGSPERFQTPQPDERIRIIRLKHPTGVSAARNRGLIAAKGEWITFLDEDGELAPDMLETSLLAAAESRLPVPVAVLSGIEVVDPSGRVVDLRVPVTRSRGEPFLVQEDGGQFRPTSTLVVPTRVLREIGGWDVEIDPWVHPDLFLRLNSACSIQGVQQLTYRMTAAGARQMADDHLAYADGIARTLSKHRDFFATHSKARAHLLADMGKNYLRAGKWLPAVVATTRALYQDPRRPYALRRWLSSLAGPYASSWYFRARGIARTGRS